MSKEELDDNEKPVGMKEKNEWKKMNALDVCKM